MEVYLGDARLFSGKSKHMGNESWRKMKINLALQALNQRPKLRHEPLLLGQQQNAKHAHRVQAEFRRHPAGFPFIKQYGGSRLFQRQNQSRRLTRIESLAQRLQARRILGRLDHEKPEICRFQGRESPLRPAQFIRHRVRQINAVVEPLKNGKQLQVLKRSNG